jgi:hypothetical protein
MLRLADEVEFSVGASWTLWQEAVVALLRADYDEALYDIGPDEVDWPPRDSGANNSARADRSRYVVR